MNGILQHGWILVLLLLLPIVMASTIEEDIRVGISLGLLAPSSDPYAFIQRYAYEGLLVWKDAFNNLPASDRTTKDGRVVRFELDVFENYGRFNYLDPSDELFMRNQMLSMSYNTSLDYVLPPVGSPWGTVLRNASLNTGKVPFTIGIADSREYWYRMSGSYGAPTSTLHVMSSSLPYLRLKGAKTVYVVRMMETFQSEMCQGFIDDAPYQDLQVAHVESVFFNYTTFGVPTLPEDFAMWNRIITQVVQMKPDVLVVCDYGEASEYILKILREKKYAPKAVLLSYRYAPFEDESLSEYVLLPRSYHKDAGFPAQQNFVNALGYDSIISTRFNHSSDYNNAQATLAGFLLSTAIISADNSSDKASVEMALRNLQLDSFMGRAKFDNKRRQLIDNLLLQTVGSKDLVIGPAIAARYEMIYPMPTWEERIYSPRWGHPLEIAALVVIICGICVCLLAMGFLIYYWNHRIIVASSPIFCCFIIVGGILICAGCIVWMPNLSNKHTCILRSFLLPSGAILLFGALTVKTHRIHRLYNTATTLKIITITNTPLLLAVMVMLAFQIILSVLTATIGGIKHTVVVVDPWRPSLNYPGCTSGQAFKYVIGVFAGLFGILLAYGTYVANMVKRVPVKIYDESEKIHYATYITLVMTVFDFCMMFLLTGKNRFVGFLLFTIGTVFVPVFTVFILFHAKFNRIRSYENSGSGGTNSSPNHSVSMTTTATARHSTFSKHAAAPVNEFSSSKSETSSKDRTSPTAGRRHDYSLPSESSPKMKSPQRTSILI